jgi:hypothetical protein
MAGAPTTIEQQKQRLRLIWTAMFGAVVSYGAVCFLVLGPSDPGADGTRELLHNAFTVAGIIVGALSVWWRRHFLSTDPAPAGIDVSMRFAQFQSHSVIVWALSEAVAACGLVLAFVVRSFQEFLPFGVASAALLVMHHPFRLPFDRLRAAAQ